MWQLYAPWIGRHFGTIFVFLPVHVRAVGFLLFLKIVILLPVLPYLPVEEAEQNRSSKLTWPLRSHPSTAPLPTSWTVSYSPSWTLMREVPRRGPSDRYSVVASQLRALKQEKGRAGRRWLLSRLTVHKQIFNPVKHKITRLVDNAKTAFSSSKIILSTTCK